MSIVFGFDAIRAEKMLRQVRKSEINYNYNLT